MNPSLINSLCYTVGWFWCVLLGVKDQSALALVGTVCLIFIQLYFVKTKNIALYIQDVLLAVFSIPLGFLLEMIFVQTNLIHYVNTSHRIPPIWIVCLYPLFSLLLNHSLKIIKKSYLASFIVGFLGAPLSYMAGASLGAVTFSYSIVPTYLILGIGWGLFLCFLIKIANLIDKAAAETLAERDSKNTIRLLYDGECPICNREVCLLQKKNSQAKVDFVDISSQAFLPAEHNNIDYETAMSQMHAIDANGNPLVGIPAFAAVYARCQMLVLSTFMRIPLIEWILKVLYKQFAKNRLWITGRSNATRKQ